MSASPRTGTRSPSERASASTEAILQAAIRVVGRVGLSRASLGAIAREAGTSKPAVLYHFGSRERLLRALASRALDHFQTVLERAAREAEQGADRARSGLLAVFDKANRPMLAALREMNSLGMRDPVIGAGVREAFDGLARLTALSLGGPEERAFATAHALVAAVHGHVELWLCSGEDDPLRYLESALRAARAIARS